MTDYVLHKWRTPAGISRSDEQSDAERKHGLAETAKEIEIGSSETYPSCWANNPLHLPQEMNDQNDYFLIIDAWRLFSNKPQQHKSFHSGLVTLTNPLENVERKLPNLKCQGTLMTETV